MGVNTILKITMTSFISIFSFALYAQTVVPANTPTQSLETEGAESFAKFKEMCIKAWIERETSNTTNNAAFQDFGEKYCQCALGKAMDNDEAIRKAAQTCMSQTLLHDSLDTLAKQENLSGVTTEKIEAACLDKWNLVYPGMNDKGKQTATTFCQCAGGKLNDIIKNKGSLSDQQYNDKINEVAATCASKIEESKTIIKNNTNNNKNLSKT